MKSRILIVDDEKNAREGLKRGLAKPGYEILLAGGGEEALEMLGASPVDLVLTDLKMPGMGGMELLKRADERWPGLPVIMMTAYGSEKLAVEAMKAGAYDYVTKPVDLDELALTVERALSRKRMELDNARLRGRLAMRSGFEGMIGKTPEMESVFETVVQIAPTRATVLIEGESGTGKELIARAIHASSPRRDGPFVPVHCAALAESLLESELFGHEKGAFTGASRRRIGRFETADGGTLFLDEVSEIRPETQAKLLRVLEEHRFERVGGSETMGVDVRLVAATNRDLQALVEEGRFRDDLYYRLNVVSLVLPPLRERRDDIPLLARSFVQELSEENGKDVRSISPAVIGAFRAYDWPGNVRELRNVVESMVVLSRGASLEEKDLPPDLMKKTAAAPRLLTGMTIREAERALIEDALAECGSKTEAAARLGLSRRTLHRKINEYGLG